ncbi:SMI1/KNR4 family protein [Tenacibaculum ovolyticum]|uniref:SMI1/KNR4 family protein n=1 Tax=Tenacibaculum ovolyticum TaxID=104270 RepID=UPI003BABFCDA
MKEKDWIKFKTISEEKFKTETLQECWGFQIQKGTKWNDGLTVSDIKELENHFGFKFPNDYFEMLKAFNGFETLQISIDPDGKNPDEFDRRCYKYPIDLEKTKWLIDEVNENIKYATECLRQSGFDSTEIEGFVPLYGHRVLVVLKDKTKTPVISICGSDIIIYGKSLIEYWCHELYIEFKN